MIDTDKEYTVFFVDDISFKEVWDLDDDKMKIFKYDEILCYSLISGQAALPV